MRWGVKMMEATKLTKDQQLLIENNMDIIDMVLAKKITARRDIRGMERDELYQVGSLAMCRVAIRYSECTEVEFRKICMVAVYNAMINQIRKAFRNAGKCISYDASITDDEDSITFSVMLEDEDASIEQDLLADEILRHLFSVVTTQSGKRGLTAIALRSKGYNTKEIVRMLHTTESALHNWESSARNILTRYYDKHGYVLA